MDVRHPFNQVIATTLMAVMLVNPILVRAAELALDAAAGGNASIGQATNGVPLVNINTPTASGLSHNKFTDYNVGQQGLILNNSAQALTPTQLGGYIVGNPNLQGGSARLILNEVTGGNVSRLAGYTEVAGQAAHVVVANPHGITCDGCGFINTPRATLATGTPQIDNGALKGYDVSGGKIAIEGSGLNAGNVGQFELITRAVEINAQIHAQQLTIVTGRNEVDAQTLAATAKADSGSAKPSLAIDSTALGGMYAGAIRLVGTEAGVGVRLAGDLAASGGDIRIDANGQLSMARSAAAGDLAVNAQKVILEGDTFAAGSASIETGQLDVQQSLAAGNRVEVTAQTLNNPGTLEAGVRADGSINAAAQLQLSGDVVNNSGKLISHGSLQTDLDTLSNAGEIAVAGNAQIKTERLDNSSQLIAQQNLIIESAQTHNQGTLGAAGTVRIDSTTLSNENGLLFSGTDMTLRSEQVTNRQGDILSLGSLDLAADDQGARSHSLENISGTIESAGDMQLAVDHLLNRKERFAATQQRVEGQISILGTDNCKGDHCEAAYLLEERYTPQISEDSAAPMLVAGGNLAFVGERFENRLGSVSAGGKIQVDADQFFNVGAGGGRERIADYYIYTSSDYAYWTFINNLALYNAYNDPDSPNYDPQAMSFESMMLGVQRGGGWIDTSGEALVNAVVQAGGTVSINASQTLENAVIRPDGSGGAHLNQQLPPDLARRLVDPLALPGYGLPAATGGLFRLNTAPGHRYLIESNPAFASLGGFLSSDYMLGLLGYTDETTQRRLGDGLYEQRLIREAIIARTGKRFLVDALASDEAQFRYLMDNALASKEALNLSVGIALSAEQVAALTHDIVWMEEREVSGEKVLVPVLYMAQANDRLAPNGALIQGGDLALISGGGLHNSGTLRGANLDLQAMSIANRGLAQADDRLSLLAMGDVRNSQGGILTGEKVEVTSLFGDVVNERSVASNTGQSGGFTWRDDVVDSAARIEAGSELLIDAGRDLRNTGGAISSGGDAGLYASRDIRLDAASETDSRQMLFKRAAMSNRQVTQHGGEVTVAGNLDAWAGRDLSVVASQAQAQGDIDLYANRDLTLSAAANERESDFFRKGSSKKVTTNSMAIDQQGALVEAGGALSLWAGNDLALVGSRAKAQGDVQLSAGRDTTIASAMNESADAYAISRKGSFGRSSSRTAGSYQSESVASSIEAGGDLLINVSRGDGDAVHLEGGRHVSVIGSRLDAGKDLLVGGEGDVSLSSAVEARSAYSEKSKSGLLGLNKSGASEASTATRQVGSELTAGGDAIVLAGQNIRLQASGIAAQENVELYAGLTGDGDIELLAAQDQQAMLAKQYSRRANELSSDMLSVMAHRKSEQKSFASEAVGSHIAAGGDALFSATRDIKLVGSRVTADGKVALDAGRDLNVIAASSTREAEESEQVKRNGWAFNLRSSSPYATEESRTYFGETFQSVTEGWQQRNVDVLPSFIAGGAGIQARAGQDIQIAGSQFMSGGDLSLQAGRDVLVVSSTQTEVFGRTDKFQAYGKGLLESPTKGPAGVGYMHDFDYLDGHERSTNQKQIFSALSAEGQLNIVSGRDIEIAGANLIGDQLNVRAGRDLSISSPVNNDTLYRDVMQGGVGAAAGLRPHEQDVHITSPSYELTGLVATSGDVRLQAGQDVEIRGAALLAEKDVLISATRDANLSGASSTVKNHSTIVSNSMASVERNSGRFSSSGSAPLEIQAGRDFLVHAGQDIVAENIKVNTGRDLEMVAGRDLTIKASERDMYSNSSSLGIKGDVFGLGELARAISERRNGREVFDELGNAFPVINNINNIIKTDDDKDKWQNAAVLSYRLYSRDWYAGSGKDSGNAGSGAGIGGLVDYSKGISGRLGYQHSTSKWSEQSGSELYAGRDIYLEAGRDLNLLDGTQAHAVSEAYLVGGRDILIRSAEQSGKDKSSGMGVTLGYNGGWYVGLDGNASRGKEAQYHNASVTAGDLLITESGRDTTILGGNLHGGNVLMKVGGNLALLSEQGEIQQSASNWAFTVGSRNSVSAGGSSRDRQAVESPATITADNRLFIDVAGNTHLRGSQINSATGNLELVTESLTFEDLNNRDTAGQWSASYSGGSDANTWGNQGEAREGGFQPGMPIRNHEDGNTRAAIGEGVIRNHAGETLETGISRDVAGAHEKTDSAEISPYSAESELLGIAAEVGYKYIGSYAQTQVFDAEAKAEQAERQGDAEAAAYWKSQAKSWEEGGLNRIAAHAIFGVVLGEASGQGGAVGGAAAAANQALNGLVYNKLKEQGIVEADDVVQQNRVQELTALFVGALAGGLMSDGGVLLGASIAAHADKHNRQLHHKEREWIEENAAEFARHVGETEGILISEAEAKSRLAQQALRDVDNVWRWILSGEEDAGAKSFLATAEGSFENQLHEQQKLFTVVGNQASRMDQFLFDVDAEFYKSYVQPGVSRDKLDGLLSHIAAGTADAAQENVELALLALVQPSQLVWQIINNPPNPVDWFNETQETLGDGVGSSLDENALRRLGEIYGQDVATLHQLVTATLAVMAIAEVRSLGKPGRQKGSGGSEQHAGAGGQMPDQPGRSPDAETSNPLVERKVIVGDMAKGNQLIDGKWVDAEGLPLPVPSSVGASGRAPNVLQTGGNTLNKSTANALNDYFGENLTPREWGRALEALKADAGKLPNNFHGRILDNGDYIGKTGEIIGNIRDYLP